MSKLLSSSSSTSSSTSISSLKNNKEIEDNNNNNDVNFEDNYFNNKLDVKESLNYHIKVEQLPFLNNHLVEIRNSSIHGIGLFAKEDIPAGTMLSYNLYPKCNDYLWTKSLEAALNYNENNEDNNNIEEDNEEEDNEEKDNEVEDNEIEDIDLKDIELKDIELNNKDDTIILNDDDYKKYIQLKKIIKYNQINSNKKKYKINLLKYNENIIKKLFIYINKKQLNILINYYIHPNHMKQYINCIIIKSLCSTGILITTKNILKNQEIYRSYTILSWLIRYNNYITMNNNKELKEEINQLIPFFKEKFKGCHLARDII